MRGFTIILCFALVSGNCLSQQPYRPFYVSDSLNFILPNFDSTLTIWPKTTGNVRFVKDTVPVAMLKSWIIFSENYNEPVYAIYADTARVIVPKWTTRKNYIMSAEKYGPGKALFFFFRDGKALSKQEINDLRKYGEIPGLKD